MATRTTVITLALLIVALLGSGTTAGAAATAASSKVGLPTKVIAAGALYQGLGPVVLSSWLGQAMGIGSLGDRIDKMVNRLGPAFDAVANYLHFSTAEKDYKTGGAKPVTSTEINYSSQMRAYLSYINGLHELDTEYQTNRTKLIRNFQQNEAAELATFTKTIARQTRDFFANERQIEAEYYRNRLQLARSHSLEEQRSEEDHQRDMQRMREDYQDTAQDLIAQRDALGLIPAARAYEKERRRAEEDHDTETARRNQDFAQQMADLAQQFAIGRAQRLANFQQQMKDQKEEFAEQRKQAAAAHRQELQELQENYLKEKRDRRTAFGDQLRDLSDALTQERLLRQKFSEAMLADLKRMIQSATGGNTLPPARDSGGYMLPGVYRNTTGRREFALSPRTVEAAERMAQRSLDQETVLALMANGGALGASQRPTLQYYDHRVINAKLSSEERRQMREDTIQLIGEVLRA